jgi:hypothetical protein
VQPALTAREVLEVMLPALGLGDSLCRILKGMLHWAPGERWTMKRVLLEEYCQIPSGLVPDAQADAAEAAGTAVRPEDVWRLVGDPDVELPAVAAAAVRPDQVQHEPIELPPID